MRLQNIWSTEDTGLHSHSQEP